MAIIHSFRIPIATEDDLREFVRVCFGVVVPDLQVCPDHSTPWRAFCDAYFARSPVQVWEGSRGFAGKSFTLALLGLTEALTLKADVNILGGSGEQSKRVLDHVRRFWTYDSAPRQILVGEPAQRETRLAWGNTIQALMASQASVRGPHPQRLIIDECDEVDLPILDAALGQPMSTPEIPACTVLSSTHQYPDGTFTEILKRAADRSWPVHRWCYKETCQPHGWLPVEEVERKRTEVSAAMFAVEYDLGEPSPESRAIYPDAVQAMFQVPGEYEGGAGEYLEIEAPDKAGTYATGADWARKQDFTVIITLRTDCKPLRVVAFERLQRLPWPLMVARFDERMTRYPGAACHDATGIGDVVAGYMSSEAEPFIMIGRARQDLLSDCIGKIERGEVVSPLIRFLESELRYASVDDVYGSGHLPDSLSALAMALHAAEKSGPIILWGF